MKGLGGLRVIVELHIGRMDPIPMTKWSANSG